MGPGDPQPGWLRLDVQPSAPGLLASLLESIDRGDSIAFGNDQGGTRFSPLAQIDAADVRDLNVAWTVDAGPVGPGPKNGLETVPIMTGETLYACSGNNRILISDAQDGRTRWVHDMAPGVGSAGKPCRGESYYRVPGAAGLSAERIYGASQVPTLVAAGASTGRICPKFGTAGAIDLNANISRYPKGQYYVSSAPQVIHGKVVVGGGIPDNQLWHGPSGVIRVRRGHRPTGVGVRSRASEPHRRSTRRPDPHAVVAQQQGIDQRGRDARPGLLAGGRIDARHVGRSTMRWAKLSQRWTRKPGDCAGVSRQRITTSGTITSPRSPRC